MRYLFLSLFLFSSLHIVIAASPSASKKYENKILWNSNNKLKWADFKGKPDGFASEVAMAATSIQYYTEISNNQFKYTITPYFYPAISWSKKNAQFDDVLAHEQLHFDITELYARKMRQAFSNKVKSPKDHKLASSIFDKIMKEWDEEQERYDRETNHGTNEVQQQKWILYVEQQLNLLSDYATK
ncbi:MAG: DUF922 domain-containing protein [Chitinophagales bacterium]